MPDVGDAVGIEEDRAGLAGGQQAHDGGRGGMDRRERREIGLLNAGPDPGPGREPLTLAQGRHERLVERGSFGIRWIEGEGAGRKVDRLEKGCIEIRTLGHQRVPGDGIETMAECVIGREHPGEKVDEARSGVVKHEEVDERLGVDGLDHAPQRDRDGCGHRDRSVVMGLVIVGVGDEPERTVGRVLIGGRGELEADGQSTVADERAPAQDVGRVHHEDRARARTHEHPDGQARLDPG